MGAIELEKWIQHYDPFTGARCLCLYLCAYNSLFPLVVVVGGGEAVCTLGAFVLPVGVRGNEQNMRALFADLPFYEHVETGETVWTIPDRGWVPDRGALMRRAEERCVHGCSLRGCGILRGAVPVVFGSLLPVPLARAATSVLYCMVSRTLGVGVSCGAVEGQKGAGGSRRSHRNLGEAPQSVPAATVCCSTVRSFVPPPQYVK
jgi:hypothetical protein